MKKNLLIFVLGLISLMVAVMGVVCAISTFTQGGAFNIICGVGFLVAWVWLVIAWFKDDMPRYFYFHWFDKDE